MSGHIRRAYASRVAGYRRRPTDTDLVDERGRCDSTGADSLFSAWAKDFAAPNCRVWLLGVNEASDKVNAHRPQSTPFTPRGLGPARGTATCSGPGQMKNRDG
ncbi:hypothetical protein Kfla_3379 [Kribbella flavida DSM 17836]|uniref:Uncharacterized protein n=1 Tax=Kribbella flavida (strain DSM 17836 / JCM 10339 / NBRC 14399) TaxID=479435 RepID=D2PKX2_KRIFD|nr:hypothetical protein Kfla_3379 [Kribbella flavida DSM 17836]